MVKLYRAYTVRENYKGRDAVIVDWFCATRGAPPAPYETLIDNYGDLGEEGRRRARERIDRFLTGPEAEELRRYLWATAGFDVKKVEVAAPFQDGRVIPHFAAPPGEADHFELHRNKDYNLSIPISGVADLSEPPNLVSYRDDAE